MSFNRDVATRQAGQPKPSGCFAHPPEDPTRTKVSFHGGIQWEVQHNTAPAKGFTGPWWVSRVEGDIWTQPKGFIRPECILRGLRVRLYGDHP